MSKFEDIGDERPSSGRFDGDGNAATVSIAVSLKRIADMMEAFIRWQSGNGALPK